VTLERGSRTDGQTDKTATKKTNWQQSQCSCHSQSVGRSLKLCYVDIVSACLCCVVYSVEPEDFSFILLDNPEIEAAKARTRRPKVKTLRLRVKPGDLETLFGMPEQRIKVSRPILAILPCRIVRLCSFTLCIQASIVLPPGESKWRYRGIGYNIRMHFFASTKIRLKFNQMYTTYANQI